MVLALDFSVIAGTMALLTIPLQAQTAGAIEIGVRFTILFSATATLILYLSGLYRRNWRFVSVADCGFLVFTILWAFGLSWAFTLGFSKLRHNGLQLLPLAFVHFCMATLSMQMMRIARRAWRELAMRRAMDKDMAARPAAARRALLIGDPEWAVSVIELVKADKASPINIVGVLLPQADDTIGQLAGVRVLGGHDRLGEVVERMAERGHRPTNVIVCDDGMNFSPKDIAKVIHRVRDLGLELSRVKDPWSKLLEAKPKMEMDDIPVSELLGRNEFDIQSNAISRQISGHCVLITGAGGSIGSELSRQVANFKPSHLVLLDNCEFNLYAIEMKLREAYPDLDMHPELCDIRDATAVRRLFERHRPAIVYHAAALKHVPMVEKNPCAGVHTNIIGTRNVADAVCEFSARAMIQVSTDKAVNPVGMMGATKRVGELYSQSLDLCGVDDGDSPRFMTVRFGNVLGSSGSIVPLFRRQLLEGRPLTVTHPDIERFFMSVREAVHLILECSSRALEAGNTRGNIFVLDMGEPVKIVDLARRMARLYGLEPDVDVPIQFVGLRPGEKLYEELFDSCEEQVDSGIPGLFEACSKPIPLPLISKAIDHLASAIQQGSHVEACQITHNLVKLPSSGVDMIGLFSRSPAMWRGPWPKLTRDAQA
ncbi:polysaccharide biosynthesis protein [Novosphingobium lentum]|uniref:polysaccharide biosynthesis protein n=1 Tax=Novosphingobium lentum TaxID=145287 RepID=UPI0014705FF1|nr:polysaccharide biosynthesis protein [Novosphingobium lentum]